LDSDIELNLSSSLKHLEHCIGDILLAMTGDQLILNADKINLIYLA